jgi:signal transduction histidine kinase
MQLMEAHKMESLGALAGGIAHEINTPIQYVGDNIGFLDQAFATVSNIVTTGNDLVKAVTAGGNGAVELVQTRAALDAADLDFLLKEIPAAIRQSGDGIAHVREIVLAVKEFSHPDKKEMVPEDLASAIKTASMVSRNQWKYVADVELTFDPGLPLVPCRIGRINQVLLNLIVNAAQAIEDAQRPDIGFIRITARRGGDWAEIRVEDNGGGIQPEHQAHIFDLFFTTKPQGRGTGQGLALCHSIVVRDHGGTIDVESEPGAGTAFIVRLPLVQHNGDA